MDSFAPVPQREHFDARTPMRCPLCGGELSDVRIRDIGGINASMNWHVHAGRCPQHGWFQAEVISRPPREIFPVTKPFGTARRLVVDGEEVFSFATVWNDAPADVQRSRVDPLEPTYWQVRHQARPAS